MQSRSPIFLLLFRVFVRLGLGLVLLVGLRVVVAGVSLHAHAAADATLTVTDCSGETGPGRIGTVISSASAGDTIRFSCSGTIPISSTLVISKNLTLDGSGQSITLDGGNSVRVLSVNGGVTFTLNALTIAHGSAPGDLGGGIENFGTATITNSTFANNSASSGGGLLNDGTVTITNSTFANNSAISGGGLYNGSMMSISNSTFSGNSAPSGPGGGIFNNNGATLSISNSTFSSNSSVQGGGGIFNNFGPLSISNSTFSGNSAPSGSGGGIFNTSTVNIGESIVANNAGGNCTNVFSGTITSTGYNLESGTECGFTGTGDLQNTDPKLDPNGLQNNGGLTQTLALEPDSPAVDHIPVGSSCPATDQRGVSRPQGPTCDIGAFEMTAADGLTVMIHVVNSFHLSKSLQTSLDAELQAALSAVNAGHTAAACGALSAFISQVKTQSGKGLTVSQATQLTNEATVIKTRLGC